MTLFEQSIPVLRTRIDAMLGLLTKAEGHAKGDALLDAKLAEDMHPLATQVRFVTNQPRESLAKLVEREFPSDEDNASTLEGAKAALQATAAMLDNVKADDLIAADEVLVLDLPNGMQFTLSAENYVRDWVLPNFYFHLTTAYAILRMEGLDIGKADFIPHVVRYMTKGPD